MGGHLRKKKNLKDSQFKRINPKLLKQVNLNYYLTKYKVENMVRQVIKIWALVLKGITPLEKMTWHILNVPFILFKCI